MTLGAQGVRILVQLGGIVLLARLLSPADYGLTTMVIAIIGVGEILRDFGLSSAAIQAKTLTRGQRSNLFWINTGIGAVLTGVVAALSVPIAAFYDDDRLIGVTLALSVTFLLNGISTQFRADLNRRFRFGALASVEISAQVVGLAVALVLALSGWGYWALVAQQVIQVLCQVVVLPFVARWMPWLPRRGEEMRSFLNFGGPLVASQVLVYASRNVDALVIGRVFGATSLGFYNRAFQLMSLPLNQINAPSSRVALPTLSRLRDEPVRYREFITFGQITLLNIVSLVLALCVAQAAPIIAISLGSQWAASVPLFQILAVAGLFQAASFATYWVVLSLGRTKRQFWYTLITRPLVIALIIGGAFWGVEGVAWAYALGNALLWPMGIIWLVRGSIAPAGQMFVGALRTIVVYALAALGSYAATMAITADLAIVRILVGAAALLVVLAVIAVVFPPFRRDVVAMAGARRFFRRRKASAGGGPAAVKQEADV